VPEGVDIEGREISLFILPSATASFTAARLGPDSLVDIDRAGGRAVCDVDAMDLAMGGGCNRSLGDGGRRVAALGNGLVSSFLVSKVGVDSMIGSVFLRIVGLGVDGLEGLSERAGPSVGVPTRGEDIFEVDFDSGKDPGPDSRLASASRRFPGQYKSSSNISNAAPGFITRVISSNNGSHCIYNA
jgi:hypothetical protein